MADSNRTLTTTRRRRPPKPKLAESKVLERKDITDDLMLMWIEKPEGFSFKAGQYCTIGREGIERAYSIVSAPHEETLELFLELVPLPDGVLTPLLWELGPGDVLSIRPRAKGIFTFKPKYVNHLLVATVTGVVPYISYLRDYLHRGDSGHRFYVLMGASYVDEFVYDEELEKLVAEHPDLLTFVPTISRPDEERNEEWTGEKGRVNEIVEKYAEEFGLSTEDTLVYACGHPGMIEDVKDRMLPKGFAVEEERFWKGRLGGAYAKVRPGLVNRRSSPEPSRNEGRPQFFPSGAEPPTFRTKQTPLSFRKERSGVRNLESLPARQT